MRAFFWESSSFKFEKIDDKKSNETIDKNTDEIKDNDDNNVNDNENIKEESLHFVKKEWENLKDQLRLMCRRYQFIAPYKFDLRLRQAVPI